MNNVLFIQKSLICSNPMLYVIQVPIVSKLQ